MDPQLRSTLLKVALPVVVISLMLFASKKAHISRKELGFTWPRFSTLLLWLALWVAWMLASEIAINTLGMEQAKPWRHYSLLIIGLRIVAIGILGPISEELMARAYFFAV